MADMEEPRNPSPRPRSRGMKVSIAVGVATGLAVGATALAGAVTAPDPTAATDPPAAINAQTQPPDPDRGPGPGPAGRRGPGGTGMHKRGHGMGMGIHGEFVVPAPGGGYQTMVSQNGEVIDVSATSIKVKSEDGFEKTYVVNDDTIVHAGDNGIADVKAGDKVHVLAVVTGDTANAVQVHDGTATRERREKWSPKRPGPNKADPASPPTTVS